MSTTEEHVAAQRNASSSSGRARRPQSPQPATIGIAAGRRLPVEVAIARTIVAMLAFQPARRRLDQLAGRLVFGERPSHLETLEQLGRTLERAVDVDEFAPRIADTVRRGLDLEWARVLLDLSAGDTVRLQPAGAAGIDLDAEATPVASIQLSHGDQRLGLIECGPKLEGGLGERDHGLLATLARQAALGIRSARLAAELKARVDETERQARELAASRTRILQAQDEERRRLERDLHSSTSSP